MTEPAFGYYAPGEGWVRVETVAEDPQILLDQLTALRGTDHMTERNRIIVRLRDVYRTPHAQISAATGLSRGRLGQILVLAEALT